MNEPVTRPRWKRWSLWAFLAGAAYVLGYGPACGIIAAVFDLPLPRGCEETLITAWNAFYAPLHWCFAHEVQGSTWLIWYSNLFEPPT